MTQALMNTSHRVQPLWLNAFEHQQQPLLQTTPLTPSELALIAPWRAVNREISQGELVKYTQPTFPALPDWVRLCANQTHRLAILYVHRYYKLDCRTPLLPWITHQIGGCIHSLGLRHHDAQLSQAHLKLACAWAQQGENVLVIFDHIKIIDTPSAPRPESFIQYALLGTTCSPVTAFAPTSLGTTACPLAPGWQECAQTVQGKNRRQVLHA